MSLKERFDVAIQNVKIPQGSRFLVTGAAGFIGYHVCKTLIDLGHSVTGLDNFASGRKENLEKLNELASKPGQGHFQFVEGDIRDYKTCQKLVDDSNFVIHLAALGSVPRSIANPRDSIETNINGFFNMLEAVRENPKTRLIFASSSSIYGNDPNLPKKEGQFGNVLSPYAASKRTDELLAEAFVNCYSLELIGLRFFNVFGERQNPKGPYAAVIPKWSTALLSPDGKAQIFGDGKTSRDFTYVKNVVYGILLGCATANSEAFGKTLNIACGESTSIATLFELLRSALGQHHPAAMKLNPEYTDFRLGDIRHSTADISMISDLLDYKPLYTVPEGLELSAPSFIEEYGNIQ